MIQITGSLLMTAAIVDDVCSVCFKQPRNIKQCKETTMVVRCVSRFIVLAVVNKVVTVLSSISLHLVYFFVIFVIFISPVNLL